MESLGQYLKVQRKLRNVSLEDVSRASKVHQNWLELLENDDFDKLPSDVFAKGYLRLYANAIGLDPDDVVLRYELLFKTDEESTTQSVAFWRRKDARRLIVFVIGMGYLMYWLVTRFACVPQLTRHI